MEESSAGLVMRPLTHTVTGIWNGRPWVVMQTAAPVSPAYTWTIRDLFAYCRGMKGSRRPKPRLPLV